MGHSLVVQWLGLALSPHGPGSLPDQGTKTPQAVLQGQNRIIAEQNMK